AWLREFRLIFGASTAASAAVLAIFIGGLGTGGIILGRRADRHPRPIAMYATLELGIALSAAASPLLLTAVRAAYVALGGTHHLGGRSAQPARRHRGARRKPQRAGWGARKPNRRRRSTTRRSVPVRARRRRRSRVRLLPDGDGLVSHARAAVGRQRLHLRSHS